MGASDVRAAPTFRQCSGGGAYPSRTVTPAAAAAAWGAAGGSEKGGRRGDVIGHAVGGGLPLLDPLPAGRRRRRRDLPLTRHARCRRRQV